MMISLMINPAAVRSYSSMAVQPEEAAQAAFFAPVFPRAAVVYNRTYFVKAEVGMNPVRQYQWPDGKTLALGGRMAVMGVLNVTPDSFSDGGAWNTVERAARHAADMAAEGADLIDVGAESTRPGSTALSAEEETARLMTCLPAVLAASPVPVSVDTYHYQTAEAAIRAGAHILNDVWGFQYDRGEMADMAAASGVPVILMHNQKDTQYDGDLMDCMKAFFSRSVEIALAHGVREDRIILDPGIGFGKDAAQSLEAVRRIGELTELSFPVLLAPSRKRFIGEVLDLPAGERDEGTGAVCLWGQERGCAMVRVHNVRMTARMVRMMDALLCPERGKPWTKSV